MEDPVTFLALNSVLRRFFSPWEQPVYAVLASNFFYKVPLLGLFIVTGLFIVIVIVSGVLSRPCEITNDLHLKIEVLKFLSRINEGENLGEKNINALIMTHHFLKIVYCLGV